MEVNEQDTEFDADEEGGLRVDDEIYIPPPLKNFNEIDETGSRLMIAKIVNKNFKSYAGIHIIGPFQKVNTSMCVSNSAWLHKCKSCLIFIINLIFIIDLFRILELEKDK